MRSVIILIMAMVSVLPAGAKKFVYKFHATPISQALVTLSRDHGDIDISFIYKELDNYKTSAAIDTDEPYEAIRQIVGLNPVSVVEKRGIFYVEALQRGKYVYTGRAIGQDREPVVAATVMLLAPRDSSVLTYGITDDAGRFVIPCDRQNVIGKVSCIGYKPKIQPFGGFAVGDIVMEGLPIRLATVSVEAQTALAYSDRDVFIPTSRQKGTAQDGIDLLRRMAMPQIKIGIADNTVTTLSGDAVAIYINYVKASPEELEGLNTSDVRKVEYFYSPTDSRFMGDRNVVNFIMQTYVYGGYTKLTLSEQFLTGLQSNASVYSKFAYGKMTYDIYVGIRNIDNRHNGTSSISSYRLAPGGGEPVWVSRQQSLESSRLVQNVIPASLRASYASENFQMHSTVSFVYQETPKNLVAGSLGFVPDVMEAKSYSQDAGSRVRTAAYNGNFNFRLPGSYNLTVWPYVSYSRNSQSSHYAAGASSIVNDAREDATYLSVSAMGQKTVNDVHSFSLRGFGGHSDYRVDYLGSTSASDRITESWGGGSVQYGYYADKVSIDLQAGLRYQRNVTNATVERELYPFVNARVGWSPNRRHSLNLSLTYAKEPMDANLKSPNVLQDNELLYYCGNPNLRYSPNIIANLAYNWIPTGWLRVSPYVNFFCMFDRYVPVYSAYDGGRVVIRRYENNGDHFRTRVGLSATATLLDGRLQIQLSPAQYFSKSTGYYDMDYNPLDFQGSVMWYIGKFYISGDYSSKYKTLWSNSGTIYEDKSQLRLCGGWSDANWNVRLTVSNPLRTSWESGTRVLETPVYTERHTYYGVKSHCDLALSVTYTLGYGKKVSRGNEVGAHSGAQSAILK